MNFQMDIIDVERDIARAYLVAFGRLPDETGNRDYLEVIMKGAYDIRNLLQSLRMSKEYRGYLREIASGKIGPHIATLDNNGIIVWNIENIDERIDEFVRKHVDIENIKEKYKKEEAERTKVEKLEAEIINMELLKGSRTYERDKIVFVSTWDQKCGIALYTKDLLDNIGKLGLDDEEKLGSELCEEKLGLELNEEKLGLELNEEKLGSELNEEKRERKNIRESFVVRKIDRMGIYIDKIIGAKLVHLQNEFGIMPKPPEVIWDKIPVIITWHTVLPMIEMNKRINLFESRLNVVAHIIPCVGASSCIRTKKDVYIVNLGSTLMPEMKKEDARRALGIDDNGINGKNIGFVFGFQSPNKNYERLISAAKNTGIHLIICGSIHQCGYNSGILSNDNVTMLNRYLTDEEINLYSLASDLLLFDYNIQPHYSSSSALHRTVGAERPVICTNTNHFNDIDDGKNGKEECLKFKDQKGLENCIRKALANQEYYGRSALDFAKRTSWEKIARRHLEIYRHYCDI